MICQVCGGTLAFVARPGGIKLFRCAQCANDFHVLTSPSLESDLSQLLVIRWATGFLSARELARLREVSPRAIGLSATEIWTQSKETGWELGWFSYAAFNRMAAWCTELGLSAGFGDTLGRPLPSLPAQPSGEAELKHAIMVVWAAEVPSARELAGLRKVSPRAAQLPITDLVLQARRDRGWYLGQFLEPEADRLEDRCHELGVKVMRHPRRRQPPQ